MSMPVSEKGEVLLLHRQELADVRQTLEELGLPFDERSTAPVSADDGGPWRLVVATPQRILELRSTTGIADSAPHIAVCDGFSRTLGRKLAQARVDYVLQRPVHPGALRLLLLHAWYRGPEKRRYPRVSIGAPVRVRIGWRQRPAMLLEVSTTGCRLQLDRYVSPESRLAITLPASLTGARALRLKGHVVRHAAAAAEDPGRDHELAVQFVPLARNALDVVSRLVKAHGQGPAAWKEAPRSPRPRPGSSAAATPDAAQAGADHDTTAGEIRCADTPDRRQSPRLRYAKPVLVKGEGASRVLMGQDLSTGGMRVLRDPNLSVGDALKIALYGEDGIPPVMLQANVAREDGAFLVLHFEDPGDAARAQLERFMSASPLTGSEDGGDTSLVVSEIVEKS